MDLDIYDDYTSGFYVSIPERVWGGLDRLCEPPLGGTLQVSIPERVWGGLEQEVSSSVWAYSRVSIPERVWGGLERFCFGPTAIPSAEFQSLRGFGVGWSSRLALPMPTDDRFQSLRGFGVGWSLRSALGNTSKVVSIPERVWGGLEHLEALGLEIVIVFQSLRGFGVGWSRPPMIRH